MVWRTYVEVMSVFDDFDGGRGGTGGKVLPRSDSSTSYALCTTTSTDCT
jgi:hypothetical protein